MTPTETTIAVEGMTCDHCVAAVTDDVGRVPGVQRVEVSLETGTVRVTGHRVQPDALRAAVEEAGYRISV